MTHESEANKKKQTIDITNRINGPSCHIAIFVCWKSTSFCSFQCYSNVVQHKIMETKTNKKRTCDETANVNRIAHLTILSKMICRYLNNS